MGKVIYTGGTFDLLHPGHLWLIRQCRMMAGTDGKVVISLNTDEFVWEYKHVRVSHGYNARRSMLLAIKGVDLVVKNIGGADSKPAIEVVGPDAVVIGEDWKERDYFAQMQFTKQWLEARRIELHYATLLDGESSSRIRRDLAVMA